MFDTEYNRKIANQIDEINRKYISHARKMGLGTQKGLLRVMGSGDAYKNELNIDRYGGRRVGRAITGGETENMNMQGGSFLDSIPIVGNIASAFGLGETGAGRRRGKGINRRVGGEIMGMEGGSFLDNIPIIGSFTKAIGLGEPVEGELGMGRRRRGKGATGAGETGAGRRCGKGATGAGETGAGRRRGKGATGAGATGAGATGAGATGAGRRRRGKGEDMEGGSILSALPFVGNFFEDAESAKNKLGFGKKRVSKKKGGNDLLDTVSNVANMFSTQGNNPLDDIIGKDNAYNISKAIAGEALGLGKRKRIIKNGKGATGAGKKTSPWIAHVKAYAKKHKMKYNEALKDSGCKSSYKK